MYWYYTVWLQLFLNLGGTSFCVRKTGVQFTQVKLAKISCIETLFKVLFNKDSDLIKVRLRSVSLYLNIARIYVMCNARWM